MENNFNNKPNLKKINLRDYDKEPLKIYDYKISIIMLATLFIIIYATVGAFFGFVKPERLPHLFLCMILGYTQFGYFSEYFGTKNKRFMIFYNDRIYQQNSKNEKEIPILKIKEVFRTIDIRSGKHPPMPIPKPILYLGIFFIVFCVFMFATEDDKIEVVGLSFVILFIFYFLPKILFHFYHGGFKAIRFYDFICIKDKNGKFINIFITTEKEYNEIRKYFLQQRKIDINQTEKKFTIF